MKVTRNKCEPATEANALLGVVMGGSALAVAANDEFLQMLAVAGIFLGFVMWLGPHNRSKKK